MLKNYDFINIHALLRTHTLLTLFLRPSFFSQFCWNFSMIYRYFLVLCCPLAICKQASFFEGLFLLVRCYVSPSNRLCSKWVGLTRCKWTISFASWYKTYILSTEVAGGKCKAIGKGRNFFCWCWCAIYLLVWLPADQLGWVVLTLVVASCEPILAWTQGPAGSYPIKQATSSSRLPTSSSEFLHHPAGHSYTPAPACTPVGFFSINRVCVPVIATIPLKNV